MGGLKASGRWHHKGQPVVYLADSPASALLEVCVHTAANDIPRMFTLLRVEAPESTTMSVRAADLPEDWPERQDVTRSLGTKWLRQRKSVLMRVPSALVPETENFVFNPLHPDAVQFRVSDLFPYPFDARLKS